MNSNHIYSMTFTAVITALLCLIAPISLFLPFSPVPISLTNLIIYICVIIVGLKKGTVAFILYLIIGAIGLPVFSGFTGGLGKLVGATGGYLVGFIFLALIEGFFVEKFKGQILFYIIGMVLGTIVCYAIGTVWLSYVAKLSFKESLFAGVIPFLIGDTIKIIISAFIGEKIRKTLMPIMKH